MKNKNYCKDCGNPLKEYRTDEFDEYNGSPIIDKRCENSSCIQGCKNMRGEHKYKGFTPFGGYKKCIYCGHKAWFSAI